jgi:heme exporter protein B
VWCLVRKDLHREHRVPQTLPAMLLLGLVLVLMIELQLDSSAPSTRRMASGLLWLAIMFAGTLGLDRSFAGEREEGCWDALRMYPVSPGVVFTAKTVANLTHLCVVAGVLIPLFLILSDASLPAGPAPLLLVAVLANVGFAAIGTLIGALSNGLRRRGNWTALLLLPLVLPVMLGAGEATRLILGGDLGPAFWRWLQLLAAFAAMFLTAGALVFESLMED